MEGKKLTNTQRIYKNEEAIAALTRSVRMLASALAQVDARFEALESPQEKTTIIKPSASDINKLKK